MTVQNNGFVYNRLEVSPLSYLKINMSYKNKGLAELIINLDALL
jgi:hypothetical protein